MKNSGIWFLFFLLLYQFLLSGYLVLPRLMRVSDQGPPHLFFLKSTTILRENRLTFLYIVKAPLPGFILFNGRRADGVWQSTSGQGRRPVRARPIFIAWFCSNPVLTTFPSQPSSPPAMQKVSLDSPVWLKEVKNATQDMSCQAIMNFEFPSLGILWSLGGRESRCQN